jgi:hypothetical protein
MVGDDLARVRSATSGTLLGLVLIATMEMLQMARDRNGTNKRPLEDAFASRSTRLGGDLRDPRRQNREAEERSCQGQPGLCLLGLRPPRRMDRLLR